MGSTAAKSVMVLLLLVASVLVAGEPVNERAPSTYIVRYLDTASFVMAQVYTNHRIMKIVVPEHARPGDTLLVAEVWDGVPRDYLRARLKAKQLKQEALDLQRALEQLDSALQAKKANKP